MIGNRCTLRPHEEARILRGHPWVYDNEIASVSKAPAPGSTVEVLDSNRKSLGSAFWNPASRIRARIYSRIPREADADFFARAISAAATWRDRFFDTRTTSVRLVFAESDGIPGLIVDSYVGLPVGAMPGARPRRWLSVQFLCLGVEEKKQEILSALSLLTAPDGIMERSDSPVRALEGLPERTGILSGSVPDTILMEENGSVFEVHLAEGQKTGWFLDQRANRMAAARHAAGRKVLDTFSNAGGFSLACARAGAREVHAVDSSAAAVASLGANAKRNGLEGRISVVEANVFDHLRKLERDRERYGLVILDPPAFAKSKASIPTALKGYKDINLRALRLLEPDGILVTCSCSHWIDERQFRAVVEDAAFDAGRRLRLVEERTQDLDHPIVSGYGESRYLKCTIYQA